ncbi:MAG: MoxR-like ATPase [Candidatus Binatota bacterium]|jgi:MoxR-like ATPase|nr:MoxR-like ATPase [Candidatus Binatota bacterium]
MVTSRAAAPSPAERVARFQQTFRAIEDEVARVIVGHAAAVRKVLGAFFAGGHVLIEGVPGLGKTLMVKSVSQALGLTFKRIQFTPDLMPSDIVGVQLLTEIGGSRDLVFREGPVFANIVLADEINRATPKTQSAVLEAMEEHQVTAFGETHLLPDPFFVLATQNPIELEGTYPLPEAQLDRFHYKLVVTSPAANELKEILRRTTADRSQEARPVLEPGQEGPIVDAMRHLVRQVTLAPPLEDYVVSVIVAATPSAPGAIAPVRSYLRFGPGPRAAQAIVLGAKVSALVDGRGHVSLADIDDAIAPAVRHRLILNFQAEAENVTADDVLREIVRSVKRP